MTIPRDENDPVLRAVAGLPGHDVSPHRAVEILQRCRSEVRGTQPASPVRSRPVRSLRRMLEPAMVAAVSALFLLEVVRRALRLEGF